MEEEAAAEVKAGEAVEGVLYVEYYPVKYLPKRQIVVEIVVSVKWRARSKKGARWLPVSSDCPIPASADSHHLFRDISTSKHEFPLPQASDSAPKA